MKIDCKVTSNFLKEYERMCSTVKTGCDKCPIEALGSLELLCGQKLQGYPEKCLEVVQKWSDEHQQVNLLEYILDKFPNIPLDSSGSPRSACPKDFGYEDPRDFCVGDSEKCKLCFESIIVHDGAKSDK